MDAYICMINFESKGRKTKMDRELDRRWKRKIDKECRSVFKQLYDYFHEKAKTDKAYERTAERFENDDFDVLIWNGACM